MNQALHVLLVEDSEDDAALMIRELRRGGYEPIWERVQTADAMSYALETKPWGLRQFTVEDLDGNRFYFHCD